MNDFALSVITTTSIDYARGIIKSADTETLNKALAIELEGRNRKVMISALKAEIARREKAHALNQS